MSGSDHASHERERSDTLTVPEAARMAGIAERTVRSWCLDRRIGTKVGGRWRVSKPELSRILEGEQPGL